jgi:translation initiation factor IF-2
MLAPIPMPSDELQQPRSGAADLGQETAQSRPPGELGGHTVQPWEQDPVPPTTTPGSKDVPPPGLGTAEARTAGPGAGAKTTAAPGNQPVGASPGHGRSLAEETAAPGGRESTLPGSEGVAEGTETEAEASETAKPSLTRPPRPPVYKPQNGHEPAPRPPPSQVAQARAQGPATDGDALVEAITKAIAENLAKAFHQSVAQAVRDFMPLSGRSVAQPKVDVGPNLTKAKPKPKAVAAKPDAPATAPKPEAGGAAASAAGPATQPKPQEAKPAPQVDPSAQTPLGKPLDEPKASQYGGTIEPADEKAKAKLAAAGNPANPAIGKPAQESADRETREGNLA